MADTIYFRAASLFCLCFLGDSIIAITLLSHSAVTLLNTYTRNHTIFRHANFIGCLSADKIGVAENSMVTYISFLFIRFPIFMNHCHQWP